MFLSSFSYDSLTLGEALKKPHRSQDFLFSSPWLPNTGKQGMQTWCKHFFIFLHNTSDFLFTILPIYCFSLLPGFPDSFWWKQRKKKLWTQQTLDNQEGCLCSTSSKTLSLLFFFSPQICISTFLCFVFFFSLQVKSCYSDSGLFVCGL